MDLEAWQISMRRITVAFFARLLVFLFGVEFAWDYIQRNIKPDLLTYLAFYQALPPQAQAHIVRQVHVLSGDDEQMEELLMEI